MKGTKCCVPRCRELPALSYLGNALCDRHWEEYCENHYEGFKVWLESKGGVPKAQEGCK